MDLFDGRGLKPMLIAQSLPAFDDPGYIYEIKWDGTRCVAYLDPGGGTDLVNKRDKRLVEPFPELRDMHRQVRGRCILDGELFVPGPDGKPDFYALQRRGMLGNPFKVQLAAQKQPASFVAFDLLYLDGESLLTTPLLERKERLNATVREAPPLAVARYVSGKGTGLFRAAKEQEMEGIIAKRADSLYHPGKRTRDWVKCKNTLDDDFVVCGYYYKDEFASIILGAYAGRALAYQAHVVLGVSKADFRRIDALPRVPKEAHCAAFPDFPGALWLEPSLVCTVQYMDRTPGGGLRQPVFRGLRDDKGPDACTVPGGGA